MRLKIAVPLAATLLGLTALSTPAMALTNLFTPVTGDQFQPACTGDPCPAPQTGYVNAGVEYVQEEVQNPSGGTPSVVEVSLGHANGGSGNNFTVYGNGHGNGNTVTCLVIVTSSATGGTVGTFSGAGGGTGAFAIPISTSVPSEDTFYTLRCTLPPFVNFAQVGIVGVVPNH